MTRRLSQLPFGAIAAMGGHALRRAPPRRRPPAGPGRAGQHGAALLLAMLIMTLVTTLAAGMVWQQYRAIQVEAAERARTQAAWILSGALDWARLILREDGRTSADVDHLGEPWAVPLAEARLSTFLAADRDNNALAENESLDAFLSGSITDAQSRWNLRRLIDADGKPVEAELKTLARLCDAAGAPGDCADRIAGALARAWAPAGKADAIEPKRLSQLSWLGIDSDTLQRLEPWVDVLPDPQAKVNVNTASAEVIAAVVEGMSLGNAQRLVQDRQRAPLRNLALPSSTQYFPQTLARPLDQVLSTNTRFFIVQGRLRLEERALEERSLVERRQLEIVVRSRERVNLREPAG
jgi:general secretion pathway protein K